MSKPSLTYFDGRFLAEIPRLVLHEAGVAFDDVRLKDISSLKPSLPFGQVPLYKEGDFQLVQSNAIARYIARTHNLYGADAKEAAQIDAIVDGAMDLRSKSRTADSGDDTAKKAFENETLPLWLGYLEAIASKAPKGYLVAGKISLADITTYYVVDQLAARYPNALNSFPKLKLHHATIGARPRIAAWLKVRPVTSF